MFFLSFIFSFSLIARLVSLKRLLLTINVIFYNIYVKSCTAINNEDRTKF